jgi:hypothetical protein
MLRRFLLPGAVAGAASTVVFAGLHHLIISNIWFSLLPMLLAGAVSGLCIAWTYALLFRDPTVGSWLGYNLTYVALFMLLGVASLITLEPVTTVAAVLEGGQPPRELYARAMPLTATFTVGSAVLITVLWGRSVAKFGAVLLTCVILFAVLGMNISVLGLVFLPVSAWYLIAEFFGLVLALSLCYAAVFVALEGRAFARARAGSNVGQ